MTLTHIDEIPLISLVGSPNSGKTTLFNLFSGKNLKTVKYIRFAGYHQFKPKLTR